MGKLRDYVCSRQVECLITVKAENMAEALASLPTTADELVEEADAVAFGTNWSVQIEGIKSDPQSFDDDDVREAKESGAGDLLPGGD